MDGDDSPPAVEQPATSVAPAPHPEPSPPAATHAPTATGEASEATAPLEQSYTTSTPSQASRLAHLAAEARRPRRSPRRTSPLQLQVGRLRIPSAGKAPNPKPDACLRLSAPPPKNNGRQHGGVAV
eukprot:jgi/Tetstr1/424482/TSEL_015010.t1